MNTVENSLPLSILDLLIDAPSSFAALYAGLIRHGEHAHQLDVLGLARTLREMECMGWVKEWQMSEEGAFVSPSDEDREKALKAYASWLPQTDLRDVALDEVGLWYEVTARGRVQWNSHAPVQPRRAQERWLIDDIPDRKLIIVRAESEKIAEEALHHWVSLNPRIRLKPSKRVSVESSFRLADGTLVRDGTRIEQGYFLQSAEG